MAFYYKILGDYIYIMAKYKYISKHSSSKIKSTVKTLEKLRRKNKVRKHVLSIQNTEFLSLKQFIHKHIFSNQEL